MTNKTAKSASTHDTAATTAPASPSKDSLKKLVADYEHNNRLLVNEIEKVRKVCGVKSDKLLEIDTENYQLREYVLNIEQKFIKLKEQYDKMANEYAYVQEKLADFLILLDDDNDVDQDVEPNVRTYYKISTLQTCIRKCCEKIDYYARMNVELPAHAKRPSSSGNKSVYLSANALAVPNGLNGDRRQSSINRSNRKSDRSSAKGLRKSTRRSSMLLNPNEHLNLPKHSERMPSSMDLVNNGSFNESRHETVHEESEENPPPSETNDDTTQPNQRDEDEEEQEEVEEEQEEEEEEEEENEQDQVDDEEEENTEETETAAPTENDYSGEVDKRLHAIVEETHVDEETESDEDESEIAEDEDEDQEEEQEEDEDLIVPETQQPPVVETTDGETNNASGEEYESANDDESIVGQTYTCEKSNVHEQTRCLNVTKDIHKSPATSNQTYVVLANEASVTEAPSVRKKGVRFDENISEKQEPEIKYEKTPHLARVRNNYHERENRPLRQPSDEDDERDVVVSRTKPTRSAAVSSKKNVKYVFSDDEEAYADDDDDYGRKGGRTKKSATKSHERKETSNQKPSQDAPVTSNNTEISKKDTHQPNQQQEQKAQYQPQSSVMVVDVTPKTNTIFRNKNAGLTAADNTNNQKPATVTNKNQEIKDYLECLCDEAEEHDEVNREKRKQAAREKKLSTSRSKKAAAAAAAANDSTTGNQADASKQSTTLPPKEIKKEDAQPLKTAHQNDKKTIPEIKITVCESDAPTSNANSHKPMTNLTNTTSRIPLSTRPPVGSKPPLKPNSDSGKPPVPRNDRPPIAPTSKARPPAPPQQQPQPAPQQSDDDTLTNENQSNNSLAGSQPHNDTSNSLSPTNSFTKSARRTGDLSIIGAVPISEGRRNKKVVSYKEIPLNAKIRRDSANRVVIRTLDSNSISNPNQDLTKENTNPH